jgi:tryptophanyl-tRNA synthetase
MEDEHRAGGVGYGEFKKRLFEALWDYFAPMRARREEILARPGYVDEVLADGAARAREIAGPTMERVKRAVGLM